MTLTMMPITLDHAIALVRVVVGLLFMGHGAQKLFGWFGGHGLSATADWFDSLAMPMPLALTVFIGLCEFVGGLCFALGLLTPVAALAISAVMLGAIAQNWPNGYGASEASSTIWCCWQSWRRLAWPARAFMRWISSTESACRRPPPRSTPWDWCSS